MLFDDAETDLFGFAENDTADMPRPSRLATFSQLTPRIQVISQFLDKEHSRYRSEKNGGTR
jgi:hypothetical protein